MSTTTPDEHPWKARVRKTRQGHYIGYIVAQYGPHSMRESTHSVRLTREDALADARWLLAEFLTTH